MIFLLLIGCRKENLDEITVNVTTHIEATEQVLNAVSINLTKDITRHNVSEVQHDFIREGKQIGGIVIIDVPNQMLDSPYDNFLNISNLLGQQLTPNEDPSNIMFLGAGGNKHAYLEVYTGDDQIRYFHYLFRGEAYNYDVWFAYELVDEETIAEIIASVSADDITSELNKSVM